MSLRSLSVPKAVGYVVCLGEALALLGPDSDLEHPSLRAVNEAGLAGAEANVAVALASMDIQVSWVGRLGADPLGELLDDEMANHGVDLGGVHIDLDRPTGYYRKTVEILADGSSRTEMQYRRKGSAASAMDLEFLQLPAVAAMIHGARLVHTSGITASLSDSCAAVMTELLTRPRGEQLVSFDVNWREQLWPGGDPSAVVALAAAADIVLVGADEALRVFGTADPVELRKQLPFPRQLVIKDGHLRALEVDRDGVVVEVPALTVDVVESVGAGDAFAAGYLAGVLHGDPPRRCLRRGHLSAARVLTVPGDSAPPYDAELLEATLSCSDEQWNHTSVSSAGIAVSGVAVQ